MRAAVAFSSSSPAAWPCTSLISLKRSRSTIISASSPSRAFIEAMSFSSRSWKEARFGRPVSVSKCARKRMRCSAARRSRRSRTAKMRRTAPSASVLRDDHLDRDRAAVGKELRLEALELAVAVYIRGSPRSACCAAWRRAIGPTRLRTLSLTSRMVGAVGEDQALRPRRRRCCLSCVCASLRAPRAIIVVATPVPTRSSAMAATK